MSRGRGKQHKYPIGVAAAHDGVYLAQVTQTAGGSELRASAHAAVPDDARLGSAGWEASLATAIATALKQAKFVGKQCVSAMPSCQLQHKNVRLPKMPASDLADAVKWEARERVNLGEMAEVQFYDAGEVRQGDDLRQEVILLAAKQSDVESHVRSIVAAGLKPIAIDATAAALARVCRGDSDATTLMIHAGTRTIEIAIAQNDRVFFDKVIDCGEQGVEYADHKEVAKEIGLCLRYVSVTFRGQRPQQAVLSGALPDAMHGALNESLGMPLRKAGDLPHFHAGKTATEGEAERLLLAAGLSMRVEYPVSKRGAA